MMNKPWEVMWETIIGCSVGFEWIETEEEEAIILDLFLIRFIWIKEHSN